MGIRFTFAAGALLVVVATIYYLDSTPAPPPRRVGLPAARTPLEPAPSGTPLVTVDPSQVQRLRLVFSGAERTTERSGGGWTNTDRPELIEEFVRDLTRLGPLQMIEVPPERLAEFGLNPANGRIEIFVAASPSPATIIEVGSLNPPGTGLYVRRSGEPNVLLVGSLIHWELQRSTRILAPDSPTVRKN